MKVLIIGTAFPLRGGIAHYVSLLYRALEKRGHSVGIISFSRQYPKFLFPGKSQDEPAGTGLSTPQPPPPTEVGEHGTEVGKPVIDSINPFTWITAGRIAAKQHPDLLIFKYWLPFFAPAYGVIARVAKRITRKQGKECKVIFIADNVIPHEKRPGDLTFTKFAFRAVDYFIVQSDSVERDLLTVAPTAKYVKLAHPIYEIFGERMDRGDARAALSIPNDAPAILFFGFIRKYKGLDIILRAMPAMLKVLPELRLIVAGEYYTDKDEYIALIKEIGIPAKNLVLATDYIANEEVAKYFSAANVTVLPYRSATQSGIVQIAYNFDTPVIATNVGGLPEVVIHEKSGLIIDEATPEAVAAGVIRFFNEGMESNLTNGVIEEKKKYSWDTFVEGIEKLVTT